MDDGLRLLDVIKEAFDNEATPYYAVCICIWGTIFLEAWKVNSVWILLLDTDEGWNGSLVDSVLGRWPEKTLVRFPVHALHWTSVWPGKVWVGPGKPTYTINSPLSQLLSGLLDSSTFSNAPRSSFAVEEECSARVWMGRRWFWGRGTGSPWIFWWVRDILVILEWSTEWAVEYVIGWLNNWLIENWLIEELIDWRIDWRIDWLNTRLIE